MRLRFWSISVFSDVGRDAAAGSARLQNRLDFAHRLLRFWMEHVDDRSFSRSGMAFSPTFATALLSVQVSRQFHTVIDLCGRCEAHDACVVTRALFESLLAIRFVLKRSVRIAMHEKLGPNHSSTGRYYVKLQAAKERREPLGRVLRAHLYLVHSLLREDQIGKDLQQVAGLRKQGAMIRLAADDLKRAKEILGKKWFFVLSNSTHYSGLSVKDLVLALDTKASKLHRWHAMLYGLYSTVVHGGGAKRMLMVGQPTHVIRGQWCSPPDEAASVMAIANALFLFCVGMMQEQIGFGAAMEMAVDGFARELDAEDTTLSRQMSRSRRAKVVDGER